MILKMVTILTMVMTQLARRSLITATHASLPYRLSLIVATVVVVTLKRHRRASFSTTLTGKHGPATDRVLHGHRG